MSKPIMLSRKNSNYLFDHVLDGHKTTFEGLQFLKRDNIVTQEEYTELLEKNTQRLIERIREFKIMNNLLSVFFALLFGYMQINCEELEMRYSRVRTGRTTRSASRSGRDRRKSEPILN